MGLKARDKMIVGLLVILAVVLFIGGRIHSSKNGFSTEKWVHYSNNGRQLIVEDFLNRNQVIGWDEEKLTENLGEPEEKTDAYYLYYLGNPSNVLGMEESPEVEYLLFYFADGKVEEKEILSASALPEDSTFHPEEIEGSVFYPTEEE